MTTLAELELAKQDRYYWSIRLGEAENDITRARLGIVRANKRIVELQKRLTDSVDDRA